MTTRTEKKTENFKCSKIGKVVVVDLTFKVLMGQTGPVDRALAHVSCRSEHSCGTWPGQPECPILEKAST